MTSPRPLISAPVLACSLLALGALDIGAILLVLPTGAAAGLVTPGASLYWWIIQGSLLVWTAAAIGWSWRTGRRHLPIVLLLALLNLHVLASRPGGWYALAEQRPSFDSARNIDAHTYWRSAIELKAGHNPFRTNWYPPTFLQAFAPLTSTSSEQAFAIWWLIVWLSYVFATLLTYEVLLRWRLAVTPAALLTALLWLHNWPATLTVSGLQVNLIMLSFMLVGLLALPTNTGVSALGVALATLVKISPSMIAAFMLLLGRVRWAVAYLTCLAVPVALSVWLGGGELWRQFAETLASKQWFSNSLDTLASRALGPGAALAVVIVCKLALVAWALWSLRAFRQDREPSPALSQWTSDATFAVASCCMVMVSPVIWPFHLVWFVPALMFAWSYCHPRLLPHLLLVSALAVWLPFVPGMGVVSVFAAGLTLIWCLHPQRLSQSPSEGVFICLLHKCASRLNRELEGGGVSMPDA